MNTIEIVLSAAMLLTATACGNTCQERAVTGGAVGAGSGATPMPGG